jgi:hypothetical protein
MGPSIVNSLLTYGICKLSNLDDITSYIIVVRNLKRLLDFKP